LLVVLRVGVRLARTPTPVRLASGVPGDTKPDIFNLQTGPHPSEHYGPWAGRLGYELSPGNFGENLTTQGLLEDAVHIGDEFRVGTARLVVTQPRLPCFKLGIRFGDAGMVKSFLQAGKPGALFVRLRALSWRKFAANSIPQDKTRRAFDLTAETDARRDNYGRTPFGQEQAGFPLMSLRGEC
jgi:hypothetical protein